MLFSEKDLTMPKKTEMGDPLGFFNIPNSKKLKSQNSKKLKGGPFGENFFPKKSLAVPKKIESGLCYAGKQEKLFWFSSLGQMVQQYFVELLRTILVSSCGLKKSHYNSRVSLHEAPTKK